MSVVETEPPVGVDDLFVAQRDRLLSQLALQRERGLEHYRWYRGLQDPPALPRDYRSNEFNRLRTMARGAWARLVVDTIAERLEMQGVLTTLGDTEDQQAWRLLQANHVDSDQREVHTEALIVGVSYVSVAADEGGEALVVPETALEVTHETEPGDRRSVAAALKVAPVDPAARVWTCELYRPNETAVWTTALPEDALTPFEREENEWGEPAIGPSALGLVPLVPFENRATAAIPAESELTELEPIMERIQELELAKLVAANTAVFRQKWATGLEVPRDPETGKPVEPFKVALDRLWISEDPDSRFGTFEASEIRQYLSAIDSEVAELAAVSRVPAYYLVQSELANPPSAESLMASETGLVTKAEDRQRAFGESWEQVVRLASTLTGLDEIALDVELEVVWRTPERRNPAVIADAAVKLQGIGVPQEALWALVGFSPQAIQRMRVQAAAAELQAELTAAATAVA